MNIQKIKIFTAITGALFVLQAQANPITCKSGSQERTIEVVTSEAKSCEVKYTKEGQSQTLWTSKRDAEFCKTKATQLTDKLASSGWNCGGAAEQQPAAQSSATAVEATSKKEAEKVEKLDEKAQRRAEKEKRKAEREAEKAEKKAKKEAEKVQKKAEDAKKDVEKKSEEVKKESEKKVEEVKKK